MFHISESLHSLPKLDGLVPCFVNPFTGTFHKSSPITIGASADSYYEYLLKQWIQTGKTVAWSVITVQLHPMCLCVCVCLSAIISSKVHVRSSPNMCACYLRPWLNPPLAAQ